MVHQLKLTVRLSQGGLVIEFTTDICPRLVPKTEIRHDISRFGWLPLFCFVVSGVRLEGKMHM